MFKSTQWTGRRLAVVLAATTACTALVAGCGAFGSGSTESYRETTAQNAVDTVADDVRVDDAYVVVDPAGGASLRLSLTNEGEEPETWVGVQVARAETSPPPPQLPMQLPTGTTIDLDRSSSQLPLDGPPPTAAPGDELDVTLVFARGGAVTLPLPVVSAAEASAGGPS